MPPVDIWDFALGVSVGTIIGMSLLLVSLLL